MPFGLKTTKKTLAQQQIKTSSIRASIHNVITILQNQQKAGKHLASVNETFLHVNIFCSIDTGEAYKNSLQNTFYAAVIFILRIKSNSIVHIVILIVKHARSTFITMQSFRGLYNFNVNIRKTYAHV